MNSRCLIGCAALVLAGCAGTHEMTSPTPEAEPTQVVEPTPVVTPVPTPTATPVPGEGRLELRFKLQEDWYDYLYDRGEVPMGPFWGTIFGGEVADTGPSEDSIELESIYVEVTFLPNDQETEVLYTTGLLPTGKVYILGFVDTDGNADVEAPGPESKDPVTVPSGNAFIVEADVTKGATVYFDMLFPSAQ